MGQGLSRAEKGKGHILLGDSRASGRWAKPQKDGGCLIALPDLTRGWLALAESPCGQFPPQLNLLRYQLVSNGTLYVMTKMGESTMPLEMH